MTDRFADGRYRIVDEPTNLRLGAFAQPLILLMLPATVWLALFVSPLLFALPGLFGLVIGGRHRWRDPALGLLALVIHFAAIIAYDLAVENGLGKMLAAYAIDLVIAFTVLPLFFIIMGQHRTLILRAAMGR
jgi:hypothetical protein